MEERAFSIRAFRVTGGRLAVYYGYFCPAGSGLGPASG